MKSKNRFARKCDKVFWFIVLLLPIFAFFVTGYNKATVPVFLDYMAIFRFDFIANIFESVFTKANFGALPIVDYLSYCVGVEIAHCLFDVVVFIPRFCHKIIAKAVQDE